MHRLYLFTSAAIAVIAAAVLIAFSYIVDPYSIYPSVRGYSPEKTIDLFYHLRLHKPYAMERVRAEHLIVGSSRSARLPPGPLAAAGESAYNAALPGVTLREMRRMVEHAHALQPLKSVYAGIDYYMFRAGHSQLEDHYEEARLRQRDDDWQRRLQYRFQRAEDGWRSLMSVDALLGAIETISGSDSSQRHYHPDGTWEASIPVTKSANKLYSMLSRQKYADFSEGDGRLEFDEYRRLLRFCELEGIELTIIISPFHASIMNTVAIAGQWQSYLDWQQTIVSEAEAYSERVQVIGLEAERSLVLEPVGAADPLFQDGVHYTSRGGRAIVDCLALGRCEVGVKARTLDHREVEAYLASVDRIMSRYRKSNPRDYKLLLKWLKPVVARTADRG